jgi:hypothetical protein
VGVITIDEPVVDESVAAPAMRVHVKGAVPVTLTGRPGPMPQ